MNYAKGVLLFGMLSAACFLSTHAFAKTDNCADLNTRVDCIVHANEPLVALADKVTKAYEKRLSSLDDNEKPALTYQNEHWLKMRSACASRHSAELTADQMSHAVSCLTHDYEGYLKMLSYKCEIDEQRTVHDMATSKEAGSNKVPAGFTIDQRLAVFVVTPKNLTALELNHLPLNEQLDHDKPLGLLKYGYIDVAQCRVQDPTGKWWLAIGGGQIADLMYIPEEETMSLTDYKKKTAEDNRLWREHHKHQDVEEPASVQ